MLHRPTICSTESARFNPVTPYGESKVFAERDLSEMADDDFSPVFLRNATVYGYLASAPARPVVNDLVANAFATGDIVIKSDGTPWRPLVHVEDVARAVLAAMDAPREAVHDQAFNIGRTHENYQVRDLAEIVARVLPDSRVIYAEGGGPDARCYRVDFSKAEERLPGFRPRSTVRDGARELVDAYGRFGLTVHDLTSSRFIRLLRIQQLAARWEAGPRPSPSTGVRNGPDLPIGRQTSSPRTYASSASGVPTSTNGPDKGNPTTVPLMHIEPNAAPGSGCIESSARPSPAAPRLSPNQSDFGTGGFTSTDVTRPDSANSTTSERWGSRPGNSPRATSK